MSLELHLGLLDRGRESTFAVGKLNAPVDKAYEIDNNRSASARAVRASAAALERYSELPGNLGRLQRRLATTNTVAGLADYIRGYEQMDYPGTRTLLDDAGGLPDIVHCHNLHGDYFDVRELARISRRVPVVLTLHDEWLMTGHCAATFGCERWRDGCGECPDLTSYPSIRRDATARNLRVKSEIYASSHLFVAAPSEWLLERARASRLAAGTEDWRHFPNAVDTSVFNPAGRDAARRTLELDERAAIMVFVAHRARSNPFKELGPVIEAASSVAQSRPGQSTLLVVIGDDGQDETRGNIEDSLRAIDHQSPEDSSMFQVSDLMLHSAKAEVTGLTVIEALACGTPVAATAVGGIPGSIMSLRRDSWLMAGR